MATPASAIRASLALTGWHLAFAVSGALVAATLTASALQAQTQTARDPVPQRSQEPIVGVNAVLDDFVGEDGPALVALLVSAGIEDLRLSLLWSEIEPTRGRMDWQRVDGVLTRLDEAGIRVLLGLHGAPEWSRRDPQPPSHWWLCDDIDSTAPEFADLAPPTDFDDFGRFVEALLDRHASRIDALEIWREPNILPNWRAGGPDAEAYGMMLVTVADVVERTAPTIEIVSAGLAPVHVDASPVCYMSDLVFLDRLARSGALSAVDAVGFQPLGLTEPPEAAPHEDHLNFRRTELARQLLLRHGIDLPIVATAWAWSADPVSEVSLPNPSTPDWLRQGWRLAQQDWPWMRKMYVWRLRSDNRLGDGASIQALIGPDGSPTSLWPALLDMAARDIPLIEQAADDRPGNAREMPRAGQGTILILVSLLSLIFVRLALPGGLLYRALRPRLVPVLASSDRIPAPVLIGLFGLALALNAAMPGVAGTLGLIAMLLIAFLRPSVALGAICAGLPFFYAVRLHLLWRPVALIELLLAVLIFGRLSHAWVKHAPSFPSLDLRRLLTRFGQNGGLDLAVLVFLIWASLSLAWAERLPPALYEWRTVAIEPALLYVLLRSWPRQVLAAKVALSGLLLGAALAAAYGLIGLAGTAAGLEGHWVTGVVAEGVIRARGPYGSPNNLALWLGRALPIGLAFALGSRGRQRWSMLAASMLIAISLVSTFSRGTVLFGLPALALYGLWLLRPKLSGVGLRAAFTATLAIAATVTAVLPFASTERVRGALSLEPGSTAYIRLRLWQSSIQMIGDRPWRGLGLDNFLYAYRDRYVQRDVIQERGLNHPHNQFLDWWTRLGLPALAIWIWLLVGNLWIARRALAAAGSRENYMLAAAAMGMQIYALAHGLVDNSFFLVDLASAWWIGQAALLAVVDEGEVARE